MNVDHVTTEPLLTADVCWGHPSGRIEDELASQPKSVSDSTLAELDEALPRLFDTLAAAIRTGEPPS